MKVKLVLNIEESGEFPKHIAKYIKYIELPFPPFKGLLLIDENFRTDVVYWSTKKAEYVAYQDMATYTFKRVIKDAKSCGFKLESESK